MTRGRLVAPLLALLFVVVLNAAPAMAHARLVSSTPAGGATVTEAPREILLQFSERIETSFGGVQVFDPRGERIDTGEPAIAGTSVRTPIGQLPGPGSYTVVFRIISGDSHPVEARLAFAFEPPAPSPSPIPGQSPAAGGSTSPSGPTPLEIELEQAGPGSAAGLWAARIVNHLSMTLVVGLLLTAGFLIPGGSGLSDHQRRPLSLVVVVGAIWAASCVALFVYGLSVAAALPLPTALRGELTSKFMDTRFGLASATQAALAVLAAATAMVASKTGNRRALLASLAIVAVAALAPGFWGHAGTSKLTPLAIARDWAHLLAVSSWVGGLAVLATFLLRPSEDIDISTSAQRFSRLAGTAIAVVFITGAVNAAMRIRTPGDLFSTSWGRLVLVKLALFAGIGALGWRNRNKMLPMIDRGVAGARKAFRKLAVFELGLMFLAIGTATALASTIPSDAEAAARIQSIATTFGPGQINLTVDPAKVGNNVVHLYFLDNRGRPLIVADPSLLLSSTTSNIEARLLQAGPGHYTVLSQRITRPGDYRVVVRANVVGQSQTATGSVTVRD
jgi:copper transport protein